MPPAVNLLLLLLVLQPLPGRYRLIEKKGISNAEVPRHEAGRPALRPLLKASVRLMLFMYSPLLVDIPRVLS